MKTRTKIILWTLPLLVIVLTILCEFIFNSGLTVPWKFVGKPSESISNIIGYDGFKLYVSTETGETYSLPYNQNFGDSIPSPVQWVKEKNVKIGLDPIFEVRTEQFKSPPPPFKVKQIYKFAFPEIEGSNLNKFALSDEGNLWFWSYAKGVFQDLGILQLLAIEILAYIFALFITFVILLTRKIIRKFI